MKTFHQWLEQQQMGMDSPELHMNQQMLAQLKHHLEAQPNDLETQKRVKEIENKIMQLGGDPTKAMLPAQGS